MLLSTLFSLSQHFTSIYWIKWRLHFSTWLTDSNFVFEAIYKYVFAIDTQAAEFTGGVKAGHGQLLSGAIAEGDNTLECEFFKMLPWTSPVWLLVCLSISPEPVTLPPQWHAGTEGTYSCVCVLWCSAGFGWSSVKTPTHTPPPSWLTWPAATLTAICSRDAKSAGHYANGTTWRSDTTVAGADEEEDEEEGSPKLLATVWCQALEIPTVRNAKTITIPGRCHCCCCCWWKMLPEATTSWRSPNWPTRGSHRL